MKQTHETSDFHWKNAGLETVAEWVNALEGHLDELANAAAGGTFTTKQSKHQRIAQADDALASYLQSAERIGFINREDELAIQSVATNARLLRPRYEYRSELLSPFGLE